MIRNLETNTVLLGPDKSIMKNFLLKTAQEDFFFSWSRRMCIYYNNWMIELDIKNLK